MDLVSQVRAQHQQQQHDESVRRITRPLIAIAVFLVLVVATAIGYERWALHRTLDRAHEHLRLGGMFELLAAETELVAHSSGAGGVGVIRAIAGSVGLGGLMHDGSARGTLALVRARLLVDHDGDPIGLVGAGATAPASDDMPEQALLHAAAAFVSEDAERAHEAMAKARAGADDAANALAFAQHLAWLDGVLTLHAIAPDDDARVAALNALLAANSSVGAWPGYMVVQARLTSVLHDHARADEILSTTVDHDGETPLVLAVLAWSKAQAHGASADVQKLAADALADPRPVDAQSRVFAALAQAVDKVRHDARADVDGELAQAWAAVPAWAVDTRRAVIAAAAEVGAWPRVDAWLAAMPGLPEVERAVYDAQRKLEAGQARDALAVLAKQPQEHAQVAALQGLALVEERRFAEAAPWLQRGLDLLPGRPDLAVGVARIALRSADPAAKAKAKAELIELSRTYGYAMRVWTGVGEGHLLSVDEPDDAARTAARQAFDQATKRERAPAEAWLRLAELPVAAPADGDDALSAATVEQQALSALRQAAQAKPDDPRYTSAYGRKLAELGYTKSALAVCLPLADSPHVDAPFLLELVRLTYVDALHGGGKVPDSSGAWLERAAALGASVPDLVRARTQLDVASDKRASWNRARAQMALMLTENPSDTASRKLLVEAILRSKDGATALATIEAGLSATSGVDEAHMYLLMAEAEAVAGNNRPAARNAWRGWKKLIRADATPAELLPAAEEAIGHWFALDHPSNARSIARDLTEVLPNHPAAWTIRGEVQLRTGFPEAACDSADKVVALDDQYAPGRALQAACLVARGQRDEARASYRKAAELALSEAEKSSYLAAGKKL